MKLKIIKPKSNNPLEIKYYLNEIQIPSRFFLAPINTGFTEKGQPTIEQIRFHKERSGRQIGVTYVGNMAISSKMATNPNTPYFTKDIKIWHKLAKLIAKNGSIPGLQLGCRLSSMKPLKNWEEKDVRTFTSKIRKELLSLSVTQIEDIIKKYIDSAKTAYKVGFQIVQIHAAHGYFLSLFTDSRLNIREDKYNADTLLILKKIINGVRLNCPDIILDMRISILEGLENEDIEYEKKTKIN